MKNQIPSTKKIDSLLSTGMDLFFKHGIKRVTIEEICKQSSVSKVTFYKHFKNKEDFAQVLLGNLMEDGHQQFQSIFKQDIPFPQKIEQFISFKLSYGKTMSKAFYLDFVSYSSNIQHLVFEWRKKSQSEFIHILESAQKNGEIRKSVSITFITYFINQIEKIASDPVLLDQYNDTYTLTRDLMSFFFYGIMERSSS